MSAVRYMFLVLAAMLVLVASCGRARIPTADVDNPTDTPIVGTLVSAVGAPIATPTETIAPTRTVEPILAVATALPSPTPTAILNTIAYDRNPRGIVIDADLRGGSTTVPQDGHVPLFRLYGDGYVIYAGEPALASTGLDSTAMTGYLGEQQVQSILAFLTDSGFLQLGSFYEPKPAPRDLAKASISLYLNKAKTVRVNGPGYPGTPKSFMDALARIAQTRPAEPKPFSPSDGFLTAATAGSTLDLRSIGAVPEWQVGAGPKLADAIDGVLVGGGAYANVAALFAKNAPATLFKEGDRVYRVRFTPNLPRAVHLTNWIGTILEAPREFEGRVFDLVGYYRGANLFGEARGTANTRSDWVIADESGAMFVTGMAPAGLDPNSRTDAWTVVKLRASVAYVRNGTDYLEARRVEVVANKPY